jgi:Tfp pilus assembly protein PilN
VIENLNLASNPFRNRTLPWTVAAIVACVSVAALIFTISQFRQTRDHANIVERDVRGLRTEEASLRAKADAVTQALTPDQLRSLEAAHTLIDRRNFSWSRLFADLEAALPQGVRVSRIAVRDVAHSGGAELELAVVARTAADITGMLGTMAQGRTFSADLLTENKSDKGIESTLRVRYTPGTSRPATTNPVESASSSSSVGAGNAIAAAARTSAASANSTNSTGGEAR